MCFTECWFPARLVAAGREVLPLPLILLQAQFCQELIRDPLYEIVINYVRKHMHEASISSVAFLFLCVFSALSKHVKCYVVSCDALDPFSLSYNKLVSNLHLLLLKILQRHI